MAKKIFITAIIITLLISAFFVFAKFIYNGRQGPKPAVNETDGWMTYAASKYGYSIKYPQGWQTQNENENGIYFAREFISSEETPTKEYSAALEEMGYQINVIVFLNDNPDELPIVQFTKQAEWIKSRDGYSEESLKIDNIDAVKVCDFRWDFPGCSIFIPLGKDIYAIELLYYTGDAKKEADKIFGLMASTFKLLR